MNSHNGTDLLLPAGSETSADRTSTRSRRRIRIVLVSAGAVAMMAGAALIALSPDRDLSTSTEVTTVTSASIAMGAIGAAQFPPVRIAVSELGIDAAIDPVDTGADGALDPPEDVSRVGWWLPGARPAGPGSTVIVGHVDSKAQGQGAFYALHTIEMGSRIDLDTDEGTIEYSVTERTEFDKARLPVELFSISGPRRLVLITCGGPFDAATGNYEHNVVVIATPL